MHKKKWKKTQTQKSKKFPMSEIAPAILLPDDMSQHNVQTEVELFITSPEA